MMILFWAGVGATTHLLLRNVRDGPRDNDDAMAIIRQRLAQGELTPEEFAKTRKLLRGRRAIDSWEWGRWPLR